MQKYIDSAIIIYYYVVTMYIDDQTFTRSGKIYRRALLRNSYRSGGKIHHDTIANISNCSHEEIDAIKLALKNKGRLQELVKSGMNVKTRQGLSIGAVWALNQLAKRFGISKALGRSREAGLVLWMVIGTIIEQGSRLSMVRMAERHAVCDILNVGYFNEEHLYKAMDWLDVEQTKIEQKLFRQHYGDNKKPQFYLYDVTSSYLEGDQNELGFWGYNRDGKRGKKQIVIGLMTDEEGRPISVEVFEGNTQDSSTVKKQIEKMAIRFGVEDVTLVGDRGMIKSAQIKGLSDEDFHYITAITKAQIEKLIKDNKLQMSLFDKELCEVTEGDIRYICRRNPIRVKEIAEGRDSKLYSLKKLVDQQNTYLSEHPRAKVKTAIGKINKKVASLKINKWVKLESNERTVGIKIDKDKLGEESHLDGCYVVKTDLPSDIASKERVHSRYKDLTEVEFAFRTMKTVLLEMRGIFVRKAVRTRAHVFVIMLAYLIAYQLRRLWYDVEATIEEGISELASICSIEVITNDKISCQTIPEPRKLGKTLLSKLNITLPDAIPCSNINVYTRKKLVSERKLQKLQKVNI